jgi:hypothetical protein
MGPLPITFSPETKVSYMPSSLSNWSSTSSYFTLSQQSSVNVLPSSTFDMWDLSQTLSIDTTGVDRTQMWVYVMIAPVVNPSFSNRGDTMVVRTFNVTPSGNVLNTEDHVTVNLTI